jgi:hypothetical protein
MVKDITHHTSDDHRLRYNKIYRIFNTGYFSPEDKNLEVYQNIKKSNIHLVVARPTLFPYNKVTQWCFNKFEPSTMTIIRNNMRQVASLRPEDISTRYHLPTPDFSLNEPFLEDFTQRKNNLDKMIKHWWWDEDESPK